MTAAGSRGALLLIDFQYDFLADDGRMPVARNQVEPVLAAVRSAVDSAKDRGDLIVRVGNEFKPHDVIGNLLRRRAAVAGSTGARWDPRFDVDDSTYVSKWKSDAFCNPALLDVLNDHEVARLAIAGLFAVACIASTVKSAKNRGFEVVLLADAIACESDASRQAAISRLVRIGISTGTAGVEAD